MRVRNDNTETGAEYVIVHMTREEALVLRGVFKAVRACDVIQEDVMEPEEKALCWDLITQLEQTLLK